MRSVDRSKPRLWTNWAITTVEADANRSADTHLLPFPLPSEWGVDLYLKDESTHPTGSLKHRLARSLFLYAICNGWIGEGTPVVEASSGSTAVSEAYFARMLGLPFTAVMPESTSASKIGIAAPPESPKMRSTPSRSSACTSFSAPVGIFWVIAALRKRSCVSKSRFRTDTLPTRALRL